MHRYMCVGYKIVWHYKPTVHPLSTVLSMLTDALCTIAALYHISQQISLSVTGLLTACSRVKTELAHPVMQNLHASMQSTTC